MDDGRSWRARLAEEPLVGFLLVGALIFVVARARGADDPSRRIEIDAAFVEGLRTDTARRTGHVPDADETDGLVRAWAREEALFREAQALGLDRGDEIVRRRLVQKIELLIGAEAVPDEPDEPTLEAYRAAHADRFTAPARSSVTACFFARELHDDAHADAEAARSTGGTLACDPYLLGSTFRERTDAQLRTALPDEAVRALESAASDTWLGPFDGARGVFLVRLDARVPGGARPLADVHDAVRDAVIEERRVEAVRAREDAIAARYEVVLP